MFLVSVTKRGVRCSASPFVTLMAMYPKTPMLEQKH